MLFISHDLRVVQHLADRVLVLYLGRMMEVAPSTTLFANPLHPYTRALLAAIPLPDPLREKQRIQSVQPLCGDLPSPLDRPSGCVFNSRCPLSDDHCMEKSPEARQTGSNRLVYCLKA